MKRKYHMMQLVREKKVCFALLVEETTICFYVFFKLSVQKQNDFYIPPLQI